MTRSTLWLSEIGPEHREAVGAKAYHLAELAQAGFPVPTGFCIPTQAYSDVIEDNGLAPNVAVALAAQGEERDTAASRLQEAILAGRTRPLLEQSIGVAYRALAAEDGRPAPVAVRSSATAEDLPDASFAGQQATILNVRGQEQLLRAVRKCWASLWSPGAVRYRSDHPQEQAAPRIAVLVQKMVPASAAGAAFSRDPVTGEDTLLIEAALGLGETVVGGQAGVDRYRVGRATLEELEAPAIARKLQQRVMTADGGVQVTAVTEDAQRARCLSGEQVRDLARLVLQVEKHLGWPVDVEWALTDQQLYLLQARPITTEAATFFTDVLPGDDALWTSGFLNERFSRPVSPLGWSVIRELLDELAFRNPLRYLGLKGVGELRVSKLYRGHPYVNLFVFQSLYKVFPGVLLPEDAVRYFPQGQTDLRLQAPYPRSLADPRFLFSMLRHFLREPRVWSPWHNAGEWSALVERHQEAMRALDGRWRALQAGQPALLRTWKLIEEAQQLSRELLAMHRWTLTHADLTYSLLRRLLRRWGGEDAAPELLAGLTTGLNNKSLEVNRALQRLSTIVDPAAFDQALDRFLQAHGHRSFHLDLYHPTFADEPQQVMELLEQSAPVFWRAAGRETTRVQAEATTSDPPQSLALALQRALALCGGGPLGILRRTILATVARLAQRYLPLREDQRYYWQQTLALMRRLFLGLGRILAEQELLQQVEDVFFLSKSEVAALVAKEGDSSSVASLATARRNQYARLCQEFDAAPEWAYPPFLRGNIPLPAAESEADHPLQGRGVSAGLARGRAVVVFGPEDLQQVREGDVLVARTVDAAWTAVFGLLAALVTEHGGQLSHAAIVAREYGLPAVAGIAGATAAFRTGEMLVVDGLNGIVARVEGA